MTRALKYKPIIFLAVCLLALGGLKPGDAFGIDTCATGVAIPPFLAAGVDPNLLLVIDNSASMLDLAYVDSVSTCFDESYTNSATYAGYFGWDEWYRYDFTNDEFDLRSDAAAFCAAGTTEYTSPFLCVDGTITTTDGEDELTAVTEIVMKGNLINWMATSKLDIQKKILTGGKYIDTDDQLKLESRGCGDRRFVKKVPVTYGAATHYMTFGVRPPRPPVFPTWENDQPYTVGTIVSDAGGILYKATVVTDVSSGTGPLDDDNIDWDEYWATRWHNGTTYTVGQLVTDPSKNNTVDEGRIYMAKAVKSGGVWVSTAGSSATASGTGVDDDANITWETYDLTHIEIYAGNVDGFDNEACQDAVELLNSSNPSQGTLMNLIDACMETQRAGGASGSADANNAFNHGIHNCWYIVKHGEWQSGSGPETSMKNACEAIYEAGIDPWELTPDNRAYVCYGQNDGDPANDPSDDVGYVGRCWLPGSGGGGLYTGYWWCSNLSKSYPDECELANQQEYMWLDAPPPGGNPPPDYAKLTFYADGTVVLDNYNNPWYANGDATSSSANKLEDDDGVDWVAYGIPAGWTATDEGYGLWNPGEADHGTLPGTGTLDDCIRFAMADFCSGMEVPEVIDPSDQVGASTGDTSVTWGLPAILTDSGLVAQLNEPIAVMQGFISKSTAPAGLVQEFADDIRMGVMIFNSTGSDSECDATDPFVLYNCTDPNNKDGGRVITEIGQSVAHTTGLVRSINDIKALSWTPLAEAYYNAIGYYIQDPTVRLNADDFPTGPGHDPIIAWCEDNNVLMITEGASTADKSPTVGTWVKPDRDDPDSDDSVDCGTLNGSTLLDDLTYYAKHSSTLHITQMIGYENIAHDKQNITTHIVAAGSLRDLGDTECSPSDLLTEAATEGGTTLYAATNPAELETALRDAFSSIRSGAAAGSAASVISSSRGGEGATYQAIFWPMIEFSGGSVEWTGEVHALFVDSQGNLYEDTNHDLTLDTTTDLRVIFYFDEPAGVTKACRNGTINADGTCNGTVVGMAQVNYLWSAAKWLSEITPTATSAGTDILTNRVLVSGATTNYISNSKKRFIFTWNDLDNDGVVDGSFTSGGEIMDFDTKDWTAITVNPANNRAPVWHDFAVETYASTSDSSDEVNNIVKWIRGLDQAGMRSRQIPYDFTPDVAPPAETVTWRVGDVIYATPTSVSSPAEGFHFLYRDLSYTAFVSQYKKRRHVVYYGGNDGMLHAVNGGFYDDINKRFCLDGSCVNNASASPALGAELWAYVPYNLLPHLKCLTDPLYRHKYYVDQRVRVFDVRIFDDADVDHPNGWGTILVAAMRFGGAKIRPGELDLNGDSSVDYAYDNREFTSAYMVFDITNPEKPPELLGEVTRTTEQLAGLDKYVDLGFTTVIPTVVTMKGTPGGIQSDHKWYLLLGSGPTSLDGSSDQSAKLAVLPLEGLAATPHSALRIQDTAPTVANGETGTFASPAGNDFVSDMIAVDFEIEENYMADVVYFGLVQGTWGSWSGGLIRLITRDLDITGDQRPTLPHEWGSLNGGSNPTPLIWTDQPITAAATAGYDGRFYWIYFGSGRFLDDNDRTHVASNAQTQAFYGIKEPMTFLPDGWECEGTFTWAEVEFAPTGGDPALRDPGEHGLTRVDQILVQQSSLASAATLSCIGGGTACLPTEIDPNFYFSNLLNHIAGTGNGCMAGSTYGTDGWYKNFLEPRERNLGQATLLGGLLTYTTYQPYDDACQPEGLGFLYGVYYQTGTPFYIPVFISENQGVDASGNVIDKVALGRGLATTPNIHVGKHEGSKAFAQTSTGAIIEIPQPNLPLKGYKSGKAGWGEIK